MRLFPTSPLTEDLSDERPVSFFCPGGRIRHHRAPSPATISGRIFRIVAVLVVLLLLAVGRSPSAAAIPGDAFGHWKLDEGSGSVALDSTGNGNHATLGGRSGGPSWRVGSTGAALEFVRGDNPSQYAVVAASPAIDALIAGGKITTACWFNLSDSLAVDPADTRFEETFISLLKNAYHMTNFRRIQLSRRGVTSERWRACAWLGSRDRVCEDGFATTEADNLPKGVWHHYAWSIDSDEHRLYINGALRATVRLNGKISDLGPGLSLYFGSLGPNWNSFGGWLDEVRVYARVLDPSEIAALHAESPPTPLLVTPATAAGKSAFPGDEWTSASPEAEDVDSDRLAAAVKFLEENAPSDGVKRLFIARRGRVIWRGPEADRPQRVWSVSKALTSTAHGLLIDDGRCTLATQAQEHAPELSALYPNVTLRHLATMTSGLDATGGVYDPTPDGRGDRNALAPPAPPLFPPGEKYQYWDEATQYYGHVLTKIAGEPLPDLLQRRLLAPIGVSSARWLPDETGRQVNWTGGLEISAADLARFGHLFLNRGSWSGKRILSATWVDQATSVQVPSTVPDALPSSDRKGSGIYGYHWWINSIRSEGTLPWPGAPPGSYARTGHNNNILFVLPAWDMVIVRLGIDGNARRGGFPIPWTVYSDFLRRIGTALKPPGLPAQGVPSPSPPPRTE